LTPSKRAKEIDIALGSRGGRSEGIDKLAGDELTVCVMAGMRGDKPATRPSEFKASQRAKHSLFLLKRVKK